MKALKILLHDLRSGGESAALGGRANEVDLESDDGVNINYFIFIYSLSWMLAGRRMD